VFCLRACSDAVQEDSRGGGRNTVEAVLSADEVGVVSCGEGEADESKLTEACLAERGVSGKTLREGEGTTLFGSWEVNWSLR
jgi:hypothetical protein